MIKVYNNPSKELWDDLTSRTTSDDAVVLQRVHSILSDVRARGDEAIKELSLKIDGVELEDIRVSEQEIFSACGEVSQELKDALDVAYKNIYKFHEAQLPKTVDIEVSSGVRCMQKPVALQRAGFYIPGGSAPLFSTVLMLAIPAKVAGCKSVMLCTPPSKGGSIAPEILYAASLCGVTEIYKVGGAQAVGAMAYGTKSIERVDKIFGPGNRYVTYAKQIVSQNQVAIDMPAGPSEVMVLADNSAEAEFVASDMLSQAEHGADSQAILVASSLEIAQEVLKYVEEQVKKLSRNELAEKSLTKSRIVVFDNRRDIISFANYYGAEHLIISMENPYEVADQITAAGSIFLGNYTPESAGDYASGTNHTLPTSGWAHSFSGVNIDSFFRKITIQEISKGGLQQLAPTITTMAYTEGLDAHAEAVNLRIKKS